MTGMDAPAKALAQAVHHLHQPRHQRARHGDLAALHAGQHAFQRLAHHLHLRAPYGPPRAL